MYVENDVVAKCSCPDRSILYKHMFLVSRIKAIPYSARFLPCNSPPIETTANVRQQLMASLLMDAKEKMANTHKRLDQNLRAFHLNTTNKHDAEIVIQKMNELAEFVDNLNNPNQRSKKQRYCKS